MALEEATRRSIEEAERKELAKWPSLAHALVESAARVEANMPPPPLAPLAPKPMEEEPWPSLGQSWSWTNTLPSYIVHARVDGHNRRGGRVVGCRAGDEGRAAEEASAGGVASGYVASHPAGVPVDGDASLRRPGQGGGRK